MPHIATPVTKPPTRILSTWTEASDAEKMRNAMATTPIGKKKDPVVNAGEYVIVSSGLPSPKVIACIPIKCMDLA